MQGEQRLHQVLVGAGADAEQQHLVAPFRGDVGVAHVGVDIHRLALLQHDRVVELGVHFHASFEDVDVLLARVAHQFAELLDALRMHAGKYRDHALAAQFRAQVVVVVVGRGDADRILDPADAAPCGHRRAGGLVLLFGEQLGHAQLQALAQLQQLVVGQGQAVVLDLGEGRQRDAGMLAHLLQRPAPACAQRAEQAANGRVRRGVLRRHPCRVSMGSSFRPVCPAQDHHPPGRRLMEREAGPYPGLSARVDNSLIGINIAKSG